MAEETKTITVEVEKLHKLLADNKAMKALLKRTSESFSVIAKVLDLEKGANQATLFLKMPKIMKAVSANPDLFSFLDESFLNELKFYSDDNA